MKKIIQSSKVNNILSDEQINEFTKLIITKCIDICNECFIDGNTNAEGVYKGNPAFEFEKYFRNQSFLKDNKYKILKKIGVNIDERRNEIDTFTNGILKKASLVCNEHFVNGVYLDEPNPWRVEKDIDPDEFIKSLKKKLGANFVESYGREIFAEESLYDADIGEKIKKKFKLK